MLLETLASISRQTLVPDEVIIVGTGSEDFPSQYPAELRIRQLYARRGIARQRNAGMAAVADSCRFITFVDDDVELAPTYLERIVAAINADEFPCRLRRKRRQRRRKTRRHRAPRRPNDYRRFCRFLLTR
jgi:glycosyltransferase involved in cell wall biosynthesis